MSRERFWDALEALDERTFCEGTCLLDESVAIALPDGDVAAVEDPTFVAWLVEHAELAPFGDGQTTRHDRAVRDSLRLTARGAASISGFEPEAILSEIEAALSPRSELDARLHDVAIYLEGGRFARHKDTPQSADLIGTLVVGLPVAHEGGAFLIDDGRGEHTIDWSGPCESRTVRWVALFGDVDHEIATVTSGTRVTLVYSLHLTDRARADRVRDARLATLLRAARTVEVPEDGPLLIACTRQIIVDDLQPQSLDNLRGLDRDIANVLVSAGFEVAVRACVMPSEMPYGEDPGPPRFPPPPIDPEISIARLRRALPRDLIEQLSGRVVFSENWTSNDHEPVTTLAPYVLDEPWVDHWIIRPTAAATYLKEVEFASSGGIYFGNEGYDAYFYSLAALEVTK